MEISKRYNSVPRCLHLPFIFWPGLSDGVIYISPLPTPVAMGQNWL